jgi:hypothetical protein
MRQRWLSIKEYSSIPKILLKKETGIDWQMKFEWNLREEVLAISHYWPYPILAFILGCLVGWTISVLVPSHYRASQLLSVSYNADAIYRNPDDYKNWQLKQLDALAFAPDVVQETLDRLRLKDSYWENISIEQFSASLNTLWRNTGIWRLSVDANSVENAREAADTWSAVFMEKYRQALLAAREIAVNSEKINSMYRQQVESKWRLSQLIGAQSVLKTWQEKVAQQPADQPLEPNLRWQLWSIAANAAGFDPAWQTLLDSFPGEDALVRDYLTWAVKFALSLQNEAETLKVQIETIDPENAAASQAFSEASDNSRGLAATVIVRRASQGGAHVESLRSGSMFILTGGITGLLIWGLVWLAFRRPGLKQ